MTHTIDPYFRVAVVAQTPNPQQLVWLSAHQCVCEGAAIDDPLPLEDKAGEYAIKHLLAGGRGHYSPLEAPQISFNAIGFPHSVMQQVRTHRVGVHFSVQCLAGDTSVTFVDINGQACQKKTMSELYDLWHNGEFAQRIRNIRGRNGEPPAIYRRDCKTRIKKMRVRSLNEETNTFTENFIEDVVFNGLNQIYKVTLEDGKTIKCTQSHQIYTPYGWRILAQLGVGSPVMINGVPLANADKTYQNKSWLQQHFDRGLLPKDVAAIAGCSTEAVKKWAYHHKLTWEKSQWNKGLRYTIEISDEERDRRREHAKRNNQTIEREKGKNHHSWKNLPPEKRVYNWLKGERKKIIEERGGCCNRCGATEKLHVHHVKTVREHPELAFDYANLEILCSTCHVLHHHEGVSNPLCAHPKKIVAIDYVGVEATYDLVMKAPHHNFVANGIVVHNSGRYTGKRIIDMAMGDREIDAVFYLRPVGSYSDRQGKRYDYLESQRLDDLGDCMAAAKQYAHRVTVLGFSEEHARGLIPFDVRQNWVMSFNVRSLMHLFDLRAKLDAQIECQQLCELILPHFENWTPQLADWYKKNRLGKAKLSP